MNAVSISKENATKIKGLHTFFSSIDLQNGSKKKWKTGGEW